MSYYEDVYCSECGMQVCQTCGCCYNESCEYACCPENDIKDKKIPSKEKIEMRRHYIKEVRSKYDN